MTPEQQTLAVGIVMAIIQAYVALLNAQARIEIAQLKTHVLDLTEEISSLRLRLTVSQVAQGQPHETKAPDVKV